MYMNENSSSIGSLNGINTGFRQNLERLSETFSTKNLDYVIDITKILRHKDLCEAYMDTLFSDYETQAPLTEAAGNSETEAFLNEMTVRNNKLIREFADVTREALLNEAQLSGELKPVVGLTLPLLKLYFVKCIFKDFIPTEIAHDVVIKRAVERQYIEDSEGTRYWLPEAYVDPDVDLFAASRQKLSTEPIAVPSQGFDLITAAGGSVKNDDQVSPLFFINKITYADPENSDTETDKDIRVKVESTSGTFRYVLLKSDGKTVVDTLIGDVDYTTGLLNVASTTGKIKKIVVDGSLSSENHLRTLNVGWDKSNVEFRIPDGVHVSTGLTEERIMDEKVIYNQDTQAKILSQMQETLAQIKDTNIKKFLEDSGARLKNAKAPSFVGTTFDCKPPAALQNKTNTEWSKEELKETLDRLSMDLLSVLQNENVRVEVLGHPKDIRILDNVQWMYGKDSEVGGCKLNYSIGLYNNNRNFLIGSSYKIKQGTLRILITPLGDDQITYKMFQYQFFISNDYRDPKNLRVKSIMSSERYLIDEVTPVQGEIEIKNNLNSSSEVFQAGA